jgi:hypothetical protein
MNQMPQTVTNADLGTVLTSDGILTNVKLTKVPTAEGYGENITLSDTFEGVENELLHVSPSTSYVTVDHMFLTNSIVPFHNLTVKSLPLGCEIEVDFTDIASLTPTLSSVTPSTAASGDPDFVLSCAGTNFRSNSMIIFGNEDEITTFVSDTEVTTGVKPSLFAPAVVPVKIRTPGLPDTDPVDFTFTDPVVEGKENA